MKNYPEISNIANALDDIQQGKIVIVVDDPSRENEGDFYVAAEKVNPEVINFMATYGRGLICLPIIGERLDELGIYPMVSSPEREHEAAFSVSIDAKHGTTTGISAYDRSVTVKTILDSNTTFEDIVKPGHVFPLRYSPGGVLARAGHTEAAVDLARLGGLYPAGVICEIMQDNGYMARMPELIKISKKFNFKIITIQDLISYRRKQEKLIRLISSGVLPTQFGSFNLFLYKDIIQNETHVAVVKGNVRGAQDVLVRVHSSCFTGDVLSSLRCDCGDQLNKAMRIISEHSIGVLLYMHQEGRGIGLENKLKAYKLQDEGLDTVEANHKLGFKSDLREYGIGAQILSDLGISSMKLLTNNPKKIVGLEGYGLNVVERIPLQCPSNAKNINYLKTKKKKLGHILDNL